MSHSQENSVTGSNPVVAAEQRAVTGSDAEGLNPLSAIESSVAQLNRAPGATGDAGLNPAGRPRSVEASTSHTGMLRPDPDYGEPHEDNGKAGETDGFYFVLAGTPDEGGRLSGYVTREQFSWLATRLGLPPLSDEICRSSRE